MQYNKYHDQFLESDTKRKVLCQKLSELEITQGWYKKFDSDDAATTVGNAKRSIAQLTDEIGKLELKIVKQTSDATRIREKTHLGWNPQYWISSERAAFKVEFGIKSAELGLLQDRLVGLKNQAKSQRDKVLRVEVDLKNYNEHDSLKFEAKMIAFNLEIGVLATRLKEIARQRDDLSVQLQAPLMELGKITSQRFRVAEDISLAQSFDDEMNRAVSGHERSLIHEKSKQKFGDSSPRRVKISKERELEGIDRNIKKLTVRLEAIVEKSSRLIGRLVIDGNNMCYDNTRKFLGLRALRPVANALADKYEVLVVFDASIREQLRKGDDQIGHCFENRVRVHIVATGQKADETLLKIASEPDDWVVSGDRFGEYPEMPAVKNKRLIRHEILEGKVFINDLGVDLCY